MEPSLNGIAFRRLIYKLNESPFFSEVVAGADRQLAIAMNGYVVAQANCLNVEYNHLFVK